MNKLISETSYVFFACRYEGTVECMTREEWNAQAKSLWDDLIDERGRLKICRDAERRLNTSSIEGAAQATLETVYGPNNLRWATEAHTSCTHCTVWHYPLRLLCKFTLIHCRALDLNLKCITDALYVNLKFESAEAPSEIIFTYSADTQCHEQ